MKPGRRPVEEVFPSLEPFIPQPIPATDANFKSYGIVEFVCGGAHNMDAQFEFGERIERPFNNTFYSGKSFSITQVFFRRNKESAPATSRSCVFFSNGILFSNNPQIPYFNVF